MTQAIVSIRQLNKTYQSGQIALRNINLDIQRGEVFVLLGPNGAGKTTLISMICGIVTLDQGEVLVEGKSIVSHYRATRSAIGLVPQELFNDTFETVWSTVSFSRGMFGLSRNPAYIEKILRDLSLWDKRNTRMLALSGGMKRRVLIAKALAHEPRILFLDEPTAGVDVNLRRDMWNKVRQLRDDGVTIILTTHYIEEAQEMADRIGIIRDGEIILVDDKTALMAKLGRRELRLVLSQPLSTIPAGLDGFDLSLGAGGEELLYRFDSQHQHSGIAELLRHLDTAGITFRDLHSRESSLEEIFVNLLKAEAGVE